MIPSAGLALSCAWLAACTTTLDQPIERGGPAVVASAPGDRDDVARALLVALEAAEAAQLDGGWDGDVFTATFLIVEAREGTARAVDLGDGGFALWAFIEPDGDVLRQQRLVDAWARRLEQLQGVDWAPR